MTDDEREELLEEFRGVLLKVMQGGISDMNGPCGRAAANEANQGHGIMTVKLTPLTVSYLVRADEFGVIGFELSSPTKRLRLIEPGRSN